MPDELTWFKWEAYTTWLSGFALLVIVYYLGAELYLIDKSVLDMRRADGGRHRVRQRCWSPGWSTRRCAARRSADTRWRSALVGFTCSWSALTYGFTHVFSGRGAFTQIGALIGTIMVANVFVIIIPNQKKIVAALIAGKEPDPAWGEEGKQRSVHNNYLTLPVVFLMIANHYPLLFATRYNWLIVAIVLAIGPVIRHFFNSRHEGKGSPWWTWGVAAAGMIAIAWLSGARAARGNTRRAAADADVRGGRRHRACPAAACAMPREPVWPGIAAAPKGVAARHAREHPPARAADRDQRGALGRHAARQHHRDDRRRSARMLAAWLAAGAPAK